MRMSKEEQAKFAVPLWDLLIDMAKRGATSKSVRNALKTFEKVGDLLEGEAPDWELSHQQINSLLEREPRFVSFADLNRWRVGAALAPIQEYCERKKLPRLTGLVIRGDLQCPDYGYKGNLETWKKDMLEVCDYPWDEKHPNNPGYKEFFRHAKPVA